MSAKSWEDYVTLRQRPIMDTSAPRYGDGTSGVDGVKFLGAQIQEFSDRGDEFLFNLNLFRGNLCLIFNKGRLIFV